MPKLSLTCSTQLLRMRTFHLKGKGVQSIKGNSEKQNQGPAPLLESFEMSKNHSDTHYCSDEFCQKLTCNSFIS